MIDEKVQIEIRRRKRKKRFIALSAFIILSWFAYGWLSGSYQNYLLIRNHATCTGRITSLSWGGHGNYNFEYEVNGQTYAGKSRRDHKSKKYSSADIGDVVPVYYSVDHPTVSSMYLPEYAITALPWFLLVFLFWTFFLITLIKPDGKWAMDI